MTSYKLVIAWLTTKLPEAMPGATFLLWLSVHLHSDLWNNWSWDLCVCVCMRVWTGLEASVLMLIITLLDSSQNKMPQLPEGAGTQLHTDTLFIGRGDQKEDGFRRSCCLFFILLDGTWDRSQKWKECKCMFTVWTNQKTNWKQNNSQSASEAKDKVIIGINK